MVSSIKKVKKEIKKINRKTRPVDVKINSVIFGFLSSLGVFVVAAASAFILGYFFKDFGHSAIAALVFYAIFVLHFNRELKMKKLFKEGYWIGSAFFIILTLVIIFGGVKW